MQTEKWNAIAVVAGVLALAVGGPVIVQQIRTLPKPASLVARAEQRVVTLDVGGLTCANCAGAVGRSLTSIPGVVTADVRFHEHRAYIVCARAVADSTLTAAVHRAGPGFLAAVARD